jgi:predicted nucleic acid-binding protein
MPSKRPSLKVFVDADALFAGAAGPSAHGASLVILQMAEITLIEAITCEQVITEVERNLTHKLPQALPLFRQLVSRCLRIVPDASEVMLADLQGRAHPKDLPILAAAVREECSWLVTFNIRHFRPGHSDVVVLTPGDFVLAVRQSLLALVWTIT